VTRSQEKNKKEAVPSTNENDDQNIQNPFQFNDEMFIKNAKLRKPKSQKRADKKEYNHKQEKLLTVEREAEETKDELTEILGVTSEKFAELQTNDRDCRKIKLALTNQKNPQS
jgi:uncharacterized Fe-S cluster-containing protein